MAGCTNFLANSARVFEILSGHDFDLSGSQGNHSEHLSDVKRYHNRIEKFIGQVAHLLSHTLTQNTFNTLIWSNPAIQLPFLDTLLQFLGSSF
jgi:hypothetical protein